MIIGKKNWELLKGIINKFLAQAYKDFCDDYKYCDNQDNR